MGGGQRGVRLVRLLLDTLPTVVMCLWVVCGVWGVERGCKPKITAGATC